MEPEEVITDMQSVAETVLQKVIQKIEGALGTDVRELKEAARLHEAKTDADIAVLKEEVKDLHEQISALKSGGSSKGTVRPT